MELRERNETTEKVAWVQVFDSVLYSTVSDRIALMSKHRRNRSRSSRKGRNRSPGFDWWRLARQLQLTLVVIVPFLILPGLYNWVELPRGSLIQVGAVVILLVWLMGAVSQSKLRISRTPFYLPLLGFVSWAGLSLFWAHNFYEGFQIWIQWAGCLILIFLTVNLVHAEKDVRRLLGGLLLSGTLIAILGICQYLFEVKWVPQLTPPAATFANRNMAAQFMVVTIPLAVGFFLLSRKRHHVLLSVTALGFLSLFLFYTSTRAGWLATTAAFLFVGICLALHRWRQTREGHWRSASC